MKKYIAMPIALLVMLMGMVFVAGSAQAVPGPPDGSPENPFVVDNISEVPDDAQQNLDEENCRRTYTWSVHDDGDDGVKEFRYKRDHDAIKGVKEQRYSKTIPGVEGTKEFEYEKKVTNYTNKWKVVKVYSENVYDYTRWSYNKKHGDGNPSNNNPPSTPLNDPEHWNDDNKGYDGSPVNQYIHQGVGNGSWFWWTAELEHAVGDIYPLGPWYFTQDEAPTTNNGQTIDVPFSVGGTMFKYVIAPDFPVQVENGSHTETEWFATDPGSPWKATGNERWKDGIETVPAKTLYFNGKSGGTEDESQAAWVSYVPSGGWSPFGDFRWKDNVAPVDAWTEFYTGKPGGSTDENDAAWVTYVPSGGWVQFDERWAVEPVPASDTYYAFYDEDACTEVTEPTDAYVNYTGPTCDEGGYLDVAPMEHVIVMVNGSEITEPTPFTEPGNYEVTFEPVVGYDFPMETQTEFTFEVEPATGDCPPGTETPVDEPKPADPVVIVHDNLSGDEPKTERSQTQAAPQVVKPTGAVLPNTGASDMLVPTLIGTVLLGLGLVALRRFSR